MAPETDSNVGSRRYAAREMHCLSRRREPGQGDAYYIDSRLPHRFQNVGEEECELVSARRAAPSRR